ncbi:MAG: hypothetical protein M0Z50_18035 [Planctomycetia bacterium]|nr:hypothetical protein [Planctomycetia bacterium]
MALLPQTNMKLVMALFLGMGLVIFRGLAALGMALLVFGPRQPMKKGHITKRT